MSDQPHRIAFAINPTAGKGRGLRSGAQAAQHLRAAGVEVDELIGKDAEDLHGQVTHALRTGTDALVVVGGDGMVHLGVSAVALTGVPLGIVPAGTGNDVARALNLPIHDPQAAAEVIVRGLSGPEHRRTIDAIRCRPADQVPGPPDPSAAPDPHNSHDAPAGPDRWFAGVLGAGFDALVNERANRWTRPRGRSRYILAMLRELPVFRPRTYTIDLDGERRVTAAMLVAVANGPSYGGGMRVCPDAVLDDGRLDVMLVEPLSRARFLTLFPRVYSGTHVSNPRVLLLRGSRITLNAPGIVAYADGERIGPLPLTCEVVPGAVVMLATPGLLEQR